MNDLKYDVFLICPVRNATEEQKLAMYDYICELESQGKTVYYPARDTNQNDMVGFRICNDNKKAIMRAKEIHVFWDSKSSGSLFDLGMAFMSGKNIKIVNISDVPATEGKSFNNMLRYWEEQSMEQITFIPYTE